MKRNSLLEWSKKKQFVKLFLMSLVLTLVGCSQDETLISENDTKTNLNLEAKSSSSVLLTISTVSASTSHANYPASNAIDGNTSSASRWAGYGTATEFYVDMGRQDFIDYVLLDFAGGNTRVYSFEVYTSSDQNSWTKVGTKSSSGTTSNFEEFDITNSTARYIKFIFQGNSVSNWNNVSELQVYGTQGESTGSNNENSDPTGSVGTVDFADLVVETSWISGDKSDRDTFDASDVENEEWMDKLSSGAVMMTCLSPDGHRTELKEDSGDESSLSSYKKMEYTATLDEVPSHGVTVAQIHNRGGVKRPWIRVYVDHDNYIRIKATKTTPDESSSTYYTATGPLYSAGDEFTISITTQNGDATISITTDGDNHTETLTPTDAWDDYSNDYYLKAGVYTEGEDIEPVMTMTSFSIAH